MPDQSDVVAYQQGVVLFKQGKLLEALARFRYAATHGEDRPMEHFALASALLQVKDYRTAAEEYRRFLAMKPDMPAQEEAAKKALERIAQAISGAGEDITEPLPKAAVVMPQVPASERPSRSTASGPQAQTVATAPDAATIPAQPQPRPTPTPAAPPRPVETEVERSRRQALDEVRKLYDEAVDFYRAGGYDSAIKRLETLASRWGRTSEVLNLLALCHLGRAEYQRSVELLTEALAFDPACFDTRVNLARAEFEGGCRRAVQQLEEAFRIDQHNPSVVFNLGVIRMAQGDFAGAVQAFERAQRLDPEDQAAKANLEYAKRRLQ